MSDPTFLVRSYDQITGIPADVFSGAHCAAHEPQKHTGLTVVQIGLRSPELFSNGKALGVQADGEDLVRNGALAPGWVAV